MTTNIAILLYLIISKSDAVSYPGTVMIHFQNTPLAYTAVAAVPETKEKMKFTNTYG